MQTLGELSVQPWLAALADSQPAPGYRPAGESDASGLCLWVEEHRTPAYVAQVGSVAVIFDGVLFNAAEIAATAQVEWEPSDSPAALVARAFAHLGDDLLPLLKGAFAALIHDTAGSRLLALRDTMGSQALFHAHTPRGHWFSTSLSEMRAIAGVDASPDALTTALFLAYRWPDPTRTFLGGVERVALSQRLEITAKGWSYARYWLPPTPRTDTDWIRDGAASGFQEVFEQAIQRRLGHGPPGIFLSGGLDSVSVAAFARDLTRAAGQPDPIGLSLDFPAPHSEFEIQRSVADRLGIELHVLPFEDAVGSADVLGAALELSRASLAPLQNFWHVAYRQLARDGAERGCQVIFTGGGGDEWLTVDPYRGADLLYRLDLMGFLRHLRQYRRSYQRAQLALLRGIVWHSGLRPLGVSLLVAGLQRFWPRGYTAFQRRYAERRFQGIPRWMLPEGPLRERVRAEVESQSARRDWPRPGGHYLHLMSGTHHPSDEFENDEDFEFARETGARLMLPYWDVDVMNFLNRVHPDVLNAGERSKALVRGLMEQRFPGLGFEKQKKVLAGAYFVELVARGARQHFEASGRMRHLTEMGIVDPDLVERDLVDETRPGGPMNPPARLWQALKLEAWLSRHR